MRRFTVKGATPHDLTCSMGQSSQIKIIADLQDGYHETVLGDSSRVSRVNNQLLQQHRINLWTQGFSASAKAIFWGFIYRPQGWSNQHRCHFGEALRFETHLAMQWLGNTVCGRCYKYVCLGLWLSILSISKGVAFSSMSCCLGNPVICPCIPPIFE